MYLVSTGKAIYVIYELVANSSNSGSDPGHNQPFRTTSNRSTTQILGAIRRTQAEREGKETSERTGSKELTAHPRRCRWRSSRRRSHESPAEVPDEGLHGG